MPSKNDISSFKNLKHKYVLSDGEQDAHKAKRKKAPKTNMGRPSKPKTELENYRINFNLTQAEGRALAKKTGVASVGVYLKYFLRNKTDLLK